MRKSLLAALAVLLAVAGVVLAQRGQPPRIYSTPPIPSEDVLRRLNLTVQWYRYIPTESRRDGLLTVQLMGEDLLVQTRAGLISRLDAETGTVRWRARVGNPYEAYRLLTSNNRSVFAVNSNYFFSLDRQNGGLQWRSRLPAGVSAAPIVGELTAYLPTSVGRLYSFTLPVTDFLASRRERTYGETSLFSLSDNPREGAIGPQPVPYWVAETGLRLEYPPLQTTRVVFCVGPDGRAAGYAKVPSEEATGGRELYRFNTERPISVPPGQFGDIAYIGSQDANLYALDINTGLLRWRYTAGTAIIRQPVALERDVFCTTDREGLIRLDRETGESLWRIRSGGQIVDFNSAADQFLAANDRFVYALDHSGRLLILDHRRGNQLSMLDTHSFHVHIPNRVTDRLYLGANDGLILCLRDRDQPAPIRHRRLLEEISDPLKKKLAQLVTEPGGKPDTLRIALTALTKKYGLKFTVVDRAFKEAGVEGVQEKEIKLPRVDKKPLGTLLDLILQQVGGTYEVVDDTLVIIPGKPVER
jgi:outer membrane protein assembly factor BamB